MIEVSDLPQKSSFSVEELDSIVFPVADNDLPLPGEGEVVWCGELARASARSAPTRDYVAFAREPMHPRIAVSVRDEDIAAGPHRGRRGMAKWLVWLVAQSKCQLLGPVVAKD